MNRWVRLFGIVVTGLTPKQKIDTYFFLNFIFPFFLLYVLEAVELEITAESF